MALLPPLVGQVAAPLWGPPGLFSMLSCSGDVVAELVQADVPVPTVELQQVERCAVEERAVASGKTTGSWSKSAPVAGRPRSPAEDHGRLDGEGGVVVGGVVGRQVLGDLRARRDVVVHRRCR